MYQVWHSERYQTRRSQKFFLINLSHESLTNYYKVNFALMQHHNYSLGDLENMMPFEREVYVALLQQWLEEERLRIEQQKVSR